MNEIITNKPRVLIVDDEQVIRDLLFIDLSRLGYLCETAPDGKCAMQKMAIDKYDITLLDIRLPEISGTEILKEITSKYRSAVIMITAINDVNTAVESMKLGAVDYIVKPFRLDMLNSRINTALEKKSKSIVDTNTNKTPVTDHKEKGLKEIDAIANGVEIKLDMNDKRSEIVKLRTIEIAREIGIPDEQIIKWLLKRAEVNNNHLNLLNKFSQNVIAQAIMGMAPEYGTDDNSNNSSN